jgi:hypothetical protein
MIRTKVMWLEQAAPQWEEVVEQDAERCDALRLAELEAWQREEGRSLPMPAEMILWFENCGYVVDLLTGEATELAPLQQLIDEALNEPPTREARMDEAAAQFDFERYYRWCQAETADLRDGMDEADWIRRGC